LRNKVRAAVFRLALIALVAASAAAPGAQAQSASRDSAAVSAAVMRFLRAFEDLDWERFRAVFADDATVYFPTPEPPQRFVGRVAVEGRFRRVFDAIRAAAPSGPPYQHLPPVDLRIEMLGASAALVTFEFRNVERVGRRTLVWRREGGDWRIVHLHASNVPTPLGSPPGS
jgi:ketosteroid isomerase-like protein